MKTVDKEGITRRVGAGLDPTPTNMSGAPSASRRVYVGNVPYSCSKPELLRHMQQVGEVSRLNMLTNECGHSRGKAIVEYATAGSAERAIAELNKSLIDGRSIIVKEDESAQLPKKAFSPKRHDISCQIRINNLPLSVTWQQLKDVGREIGPVIRSEIPLDRLGASRGVGTILFEKYEDAIQAVKLLNGAVFNDRRVEAILDARPVGT